MEKSWDVRELRSHWGLYEVVLAARHCFNDVYVLCDRLLVQSGCYSGLAR